MNWSGLKHAGLFGLFSAGSRKGKQRSAAVKRLNDRLDKRLKRTKSRSSSDSSIILRKRDESDE